MTETNMTVAGWIVMTVSIGSVLAVFSFCMYRTLTVEPIETEPTDDQQQ